MFTSIRAITSEDLARWYGLIDCDWGSGLLRSTNPLCMNEAKWFIEGNPYCDTHKAAIENILRSNEEEANT